MTHRGSRGRKLDLTRRDHQSVQEVRQDIQNETRVGVVTALQRNRNRDAARGDHDRAGRHHDAGMAREDELQPGLEPTVLGPPPPED